MAPFLEVIGISRSQNVRIGRQTLSPWYGGDVPGVDIQHGTFAVPLYVDLADGQTKRDLQHHSTLGSYIDLSLSAGATPFTSDLFWATRPTLTGAASPVTVGTTGVLQSRTFGTTTANAGNGAYLTVPRGNLAAGASIAVPTPAGATRQDIVVASANGVFSLVLGVEGGGLPATPAGYTLLGTLSTTTAGVITPAATGPTA